jgi:hypothetical protein
MAPGLNTLDPKKWALPCDMKKTGSFRRAVSRIFLETFSRQKKLFVALHF